MALLRSTTLLLAARCFTQLLGHYFHFPCETKFTIHNPLALRWTVYNFNKQTEQHRKRYIVSPCRRILSIVSEFHMFAGISVQLELVVKLLWRKLEEKQRWPTTNSFHSRQLEQNDIKMIPSPVIERAELVTRDQSRPSDYHSYPGKLSGSGQRSTYIEGHILSASLGSN